MQLSYIDIHSHLQFRDFDNDREEVIARMVEKKVGAIVVGTDFYSSKEAISLAEKNKNIFATVGLHPNDNKKEIFNFDEYKKLAQEKKVVAIGECGLDYFRNDSSEEKDRQKKIFEAHIDLAVSENLPLMIHVRDAGPNDSVVRAHDDAIKILELKKILHGDKLRGNIHFFSGSLEEAKKYFDLNFTISFAGVITFTNDYDDVIKNSPIEMIMAETDAPFVAPVPHRGKRSEPIYATEVVKKIAEIRGEDFETVRTILLENTRRIFKL